ncbi:glycosyltransferase [Pseudoxanthomonas gei]|nr:glycosyltransferase [Pseudoxanthomonas gei]
MSRLSASTIAAEDVAFADLPADPAPAPAAPRLRLLLITDTSVVFSGGSERFLRNLVGLLPRERYQITLVELSATAYAGPKHALAELQHVSLVSLPVNAIYGRGGRHAWRQLDTMVRQGRYDIVQSHHEKSDLLNALLTPPAGCMRISNRRDMGYKKSAKLKWLFRFLNPRFDRVIAPAQPILSELSRAEGLDSARMLWIPNGVDTRKFRPWPRGERQAARHSLRLDDDSIAFVCIARMTAEKCHGDLLSAFAQVHAQVPQARLFLVGQGPLRAEIERQVAAAGLGHAVTLLGMRPDIESVLPALDIGLLASSTEGMSNAILEMASCGLPVIATDVGGNPSLVEPEVNGLLVPSGNSGLLAQAMARLAVEPAQRLRMGQAARARIEREFSLDAMVRSFDNCYRQLVLPASLATASAA